jgi:hypothetical protein
MAMQTAAAHAAKRGARPSRVVTHDYTAGSFGVAPVDACTQLVEQQNTCFGFAARPSEHFFSISVADDSGTPVSGNVKVVVSETETEDYAFCGATAQPIPLNGHTDVFIVLNDQSADSPCAGIATTGTVTATFSHPSGHEAHDPHAHHH